MTSSEFSYLLGMITGKGTIKRGNDITEVFIEIPHKNLEIEGKDTQLSIKASLIDIKEIIEPLIGERLSIIQQRAKTIIKFSKRNENFLMREIRRYFGQDISWKKFRIPKEIFGFNSDFKKEYMRGLSDVTGHIRSSNLAYGLKFNHRIYIEIPHNWMLVVDICNLLKELDVPVQNIDWAHPNMRDSNLDKYNSGNKYFWKKEHQIKIFADEFIKVGFKIFHKSELLKYFANKNIQEWNILVRNKIDKAKNNEKRLNWERKLNNLEEKHHKFYWETRDLKKPKPRHPMENDKSIPENIRGSHFDSWKEIAAKLGYKE